MNQVERIKELCKQRKIPLYRLEKDLGFANAYISGLKKGYMPPDRLSAVARYLGVSESYLTTGIDSVHERIDERTNEERFLAETLFTVRGWSVSGDSDGNVVIESEGISYTFNRQAYDSFCDEVNTCFDDEFEKLKSTALISLTIRPDLNNHESLEHLNKISNMFRQDLIAAHKNEGATTEQLKEDARKIMEKAKE